MSSVLSPYGRVASISSEGISSDGRGLNAQRKNRASLLMGGVTGAFGNLRFGRKRPPPGRGPQPIPARVLPDVIEISAPLPDHEMEERNRLREEAAQAIGICTYPSHHTPLERADSTEDDEDEEALRTPADTSDLGRFSRNPTTSSGSSPEFLSKSFNGEHSIPVATNETRNRSGSIAHMRNSSTAFSAVPLYPTDVLSLNAFLVWDGHLPKYSQPSTMRIFALTAKGWKNRYIVFSTPQMVLSKMRIPASSFLHVFKSAEPDEKELERLEINEDSVIFVSEDEVGGRRSVIKVGGLDVGSGKQQSGKVSQTIWHLQITDSAESQKWISTIKNAILGQRTIRAGLGHTTPSSLSEPRGDLDVMLSIRAQGLSTPLHSPTMTSPAREVIASPISDGHYASSISSQSIRSQATVPKNPVATLKGFFSSRPRSSSLATSVYSEHPQQGDDGTSRPGKLKVRTNNLNGNPSGPPSASTTPVQRTGRLLSSPWDASSKRSILSERQSSVQWGSATVDGQQDAHSRPAVEGRSNRAMSLGSTPLRPPPRNPNRWGATRPTSPVDEQGFRYVNRDPRVTTVFGARPSMDSSDPGHPDIMAAPTIDRRSRVSSLQSTSTQTSENAASTNDKSTVSTKRSSRRWSKPLPQRLTPPAGPPPAIPPLSSPAKMDERQSSASSVRSSTQSTSFSKRDSLSSALSADSSVHSASATAPPSTRSRISMPPPPRPAPTTALPPAPDTDTSKVSEGSSSKNSFRNSVTQRAMRLSTIAAPKPPPSGTLPPRPDEVDRPVSRGHRKSTSSSGIQLDTIPEPSHQRNQSFHSRHSITAAAHPPPVGPLPPPPNGALTPSATPPSSRRSSLKQRFKELSGYHPNRLSSSSISHEGNGSSTPTGIPQYYSHSAPTSPLERVTFGGVYNTENDLDEAEEDPDTPSFLQMSTPTLHSTAGVRMYEEENMHLPQDTLDHVVSLSPPPRRQSIHKALVERNVIAKRNSPSPSSVAPSVSAVGPTTTDTPAPPASANGADTTITTTTTIDTSDSPAQPSSAHSAPSIITSFTSDDQESTQDQDHDNNTDDNDMASPTDSVDHEGYEASRPSHDDSRRVFSLSPPPPSVLSLVAQAPASPTSI